MRHLHAGDWLFFRLRPVNFPTARLAALCFLLPTLFGEESFRRIVGLFKDPRLSASVRRKEIQKFFVFEPDEFWRRHCHFAGSGAERGIAIGSERIDDFIVNVLIPFLLLYARTFKDQTVRASVIDLFERLPRLQENAITRLIERQLLKDRIRLHTALLQQGAIQLYKYSCSQGRCGECGLAP